MASFRTERRERIRREHGPHRDHRVNYSLVVLFTDLRKAELDVADLSKDKSPARSLIYLDVSMHYHVFF